MFPYSEIAEVLDVVKVLDVLLLAEVPEDVDVAIGPLVGGEDVVVGDDDELLRVPDLGVGPELLLEDADGAGAADVVRHEHVDVDPDVLPGLEAGALRRPRQDLLRHRHRALHLRGSHASSAGRSASSQHNVHQVSDSATVPRRWTPARARARRRRVRGMAWPGGSRPRGAAS
jgi:hypothetical protein